DVAAPPSRYNRARTKRGGDLDGYLLVLGADDRLTMALERLVPGARFKTARTAAETEGLGIEAVVIAGQHPFEELTQVRVHPRLYDAPVVLVAPGHKLPADDWHDAKVWPLTNTGFDLIDDLVDRVGRLLARSRHPAGRSLEAV